MTRSNGRPAAGALPAVAAAALLAACGADAAPSSGQPTQESTAAAASAGPPPAGATSRVVVNGVDLTDIGYDHGDPDAPIVMVEFSDFGCPYCAKHALETFPVLERDFVATGKVLYKYVPFVMGMFPNGDRAARAAECAGEQGAFWPMHDSVYARQGEWKRSGEPDALLASLARGIVANEGRWTSCVSTGRRSARTSAANHAARRLGVRATPTFFIDGQMVEGALPLPVMRGGLNALLRERGAQ